MNSLNLKSIVNCQRSNVASCRRAGFSLIEVILVVGIIAIVSVVTLANYSSLRNSKALENLVNRIAADISYTIERSKTQESGLQWWMNFQTPAGDDFYLICNGISYSAGGCGSGAQVQRVQITQGLSISYSGDLIFEKSTGLPVDASGVRITSPITITVSSSAGLTPKNIIIDKNGRVDY